MSATHVQVRNQFLKTLLSMTGSESLRDECAEIYQLGGCDSATVSRLPIFHNNREQVKQENYRGR